MLNTLLSGSASKVFHTQSFFCLQTLNAQLCRAACRGCLGFCRAACLKRPEKLALFAPEPAVLMYLPVCLHFYVLLSFLFNDAHVWRIFPQLYQRFQSLSAIRILCYFSRAVSQIISEKHAGCTLSTH